MPPNAAVLGEAPVPRLGVGRTACPHFEPRRVRQANVHEWRIAMRVVAGDTRRLGRVNAFQAANSPPVPRCCSL